MSSTNVARAWALGLAITHACSCGGGGAGASSDAGSDGRADAGIDAVVPGLDAADADAGPPRLLFVSRSAGYQHAVVTRSAPGDLALAEVVVRGVAAELGMTTDFLYTAEEVSSFDAAAFADYRCVLFYTTGELGFSDAARSALLESVRAGGCFVGAHSATDTYRAFAPYAEMIGATQYADGPAHEWCECHPWHQEVRVLVDDPTDPIVGHLESGFTITDEIYQLEDFSRDRVHTLLHLDDTSVDLSRADRTDGDFALAWTRSFGDGRVFYTALGHEPSTWGDERFTRMLREGLRWAARLP